VKPKLWFAPIGLVAALAGAATGAMQDVCGPFTDVSPALCPYVLEMYYLGVTAGTSPTTFSPDSVVTRGQAAVFVSKGVNQAIARSSRRAALGQWWTRVDDQISQIGWTQVADYPGLPIADGADIWVPGQVPGEVSRVRASDGKLLETWTGAEEATSALAAMGRIFITGATAQGTLFMIDPAQPVGEVVTVADNLGGGEFGGTRSLAFDGSRIWTAQAGTPFIPIPPYPLYSIAIVTPGSWDVQTITDGFTHPVAVVFDGTSIWVVDVGPPLLLKKLDAAGAVVQAVPIPSVSDYFVRPTFDGANIWVPSGDTHTVTVIRAATGEVVATLSAPGVAGTAAFDGSRVLTGSELWDAQTLQHLGTTPAGPACSDGVNFWFAVESAPGYLVRM